MSYNNPMTLDLHPSSNRNRMSRYNQPSRRFKVNRDVANDARWKGNLSRPYAIGGLLIAFSLINLLGGCSNSINVNSTFPKPIVPVLPANIIGVYNDELSSFSYKEEEKNREKWKIKAGKAHITLFNTIFESMFSQFDHQITNWPSDNKSANRKPNNNKSNRNKSNRNKSNNKSDDSKPNEKDKDKTTLKKADLYIVPYIKEFQYSSPKETRLNVYEVWFKYNIKVYDNQRSLIADWIMSSYGKTPTAMLKSKDKAMEQAVVMSLRDLGASLSLGFQRVPEVRDWLASNPVASVQIRQAPN